MVCGKLLLDRADTTRLTLNTRDVPAHISKSLIDPLFQQVQPCIENRSQHIRIIVHVLLGHVGLDSMLFDASMMS